MLGKDQDDKGRELNVGERNGEGYRQAGSGSEWLRRGEVWFRVEIGIEWVCLMLLLAGLSWGAIILCILRVAVEVGSNNKSRHANENIFMHRASDMKGGLGSFCRVYVQS